MKLVYITWCGSDVYHITAFDKELPIDGRGVLTYTRCGEIGPRSTEEYNKYIKKGKRICKRCLKSYVKRFGGEDLFADLL